MGICSSKQQAVDSSYRKNNKDRNTNKEIKMSRTQTVRNQRQLTQTKSTESKKKQGQKIQTDSTINSKGNVLGTVSDPKGVSAKVNKTETINAKKLSPREAARLAAEKRLEESTKELTKGQLGKKLAEQRGLKV